MAKQAVLKSPAVEPADTGSAVRWRDGARRVPDQPQTRPAGDHALGDAGGAAQLRGDRLHRRRRGPWPRRRRRGTFGWAAGDLRLRLPRRPRRRPRRPAAAGARSRARGRAAGADRRRRPRPSGARGDGGGARAGQADLPVHPVLPSGRGGDAAGAGRAPQPAERPRRAGARSAHAPSMGWRPRSPR